MGGVAGWTQSTQDKLSVMVGFFFKGQDIRRHRYQPPVEAVPEPEPVVEHPGDVEIGGLHILEFHWNTLLGGGGLVLVLILAILVTWCCIKRLVQQFCVHTCMICCERGEGRARQGGDSGKATRGTHG